MKAACYETNGTARDVLRVTEVDAPEPGPGQVRVHIAVSGLNPTDVKTRDGTTPQQIDEFQIPHQDGAGAIDAVGTGVDPDRVGQRVWLWFTAKGQKWGTAAEWAVVEEHLAVPLPDEVSYDLGANLGVPAMTAYHCLFADGPVDGKTVLVHGGAGAVGHFAIELAKRGGAQVLTTVSSPAKAELAKHAGADHVVNYRDADATKQLSDIAPSIDRIVEVSLKQNLELDLALSHAGTTIVTYAATGDFTLPVRSCMSANVTLRFVLLYGVGAEALGLAATQITQALREGWLTELPSHRYNLADIATAHEAQEEGVTGKILIDPA